MTRTVCDRFTALSTGNLPRTDEDLQRAFNGAARYPYRVDPGTLKKRVVDRLAQMREREPRLSEREICRVADIDVHTIQNIKKGHTPAGDTLAALARAMGVPTAYFTDEDGTAQRPEIVRSDINSNSRHEIPLIVDYIVGEVKAGAWLEAVEWPEEERIPLAVPVDPLYERHPHFGVIVRGTSMDELYPPGTVLICVRLMDLDREPQDGERVVVYRTRPDGLIEATAKEYRLVNGAAELHPRSHDRRYKHPVKLLEGSRDQEGIEVAIHAIVIGSYRPEKPIIHRAR